MVIGGGLVGLAAAWQCLRLAPGARLLLLEKEPACAMHQSGRNSGVVHAGIYYRPGSAKAVMCRRGREMLLGFCRARGVAHRVCGKLVLAVDRREEDRLAGLARRGRANGLEGLRLLGPGEIRRLEPAAAGRAALFVPQTGVVDFGQVAAALAGLVREAGGEIVFNAGVERIREDAAGLTVTAGGVEVRCRFLLACAGLHADRVARLAGLEPPARIVPFRGEYYRLRPEKSGMVRGLVYPVADPRLPFLGVHLTRGVHGVVEAGPNAVLALAREGYDWGRVSPADLIELCRYAGFRRMARRWWRVGTAETARSLWRRLFVASLRRLVPGIRGRDLEPAPAGVRAQAVFPDGSMAHDFVFAEGERSLHVINAPSPAATASLAIGRELAGRVRERL